MAALVCGWFWEMWNFWAMPKWEYNIAFADVLHVFEMPLLGYGGYLPFGLEVFAVYHFLNGAVGGRDYLRLTSPRRAPSEPKRTPRFRFLATFNLWKGFVRILHAPRRTPM